MSMKKRQSRGQAKQADHVITEGSKIRQSPKSSHVISHVLTTVSSGNRSCCVEGDVLSISVSNRLEIVFFSLE